MQLKQFIEYHRQALQADEIRHNLLLFILERAEASETDILTWTLGGPGQCAVKYPNRAFVLGDLTESQCKRLAELTVDLPYPGVLGPGSTAKSFADAAIALGIRFAEHIPQLILALHREPNESKVPGRARQVTASDSDIFREWTLAFTREAVPHDPIPSNEELTRTINEGRHWFWLLDEEPVSLAGIGRRTRTAGVINSVYTPMHFRQRGFAGAVTAAVAKTIFAEGRKTVCLYTDVRNLASNRCYLRIGFQPFCESWHVVKGS